MNIDSLIQAVDQASTPTDLIQAVQALADTRAEAAIPTLIAALGYNNPSAAIAAMYGLVSIGRKAVEPLITLMDDYNYGARAYTVRALATIGEPRSLDILINCAENDFAPSVRRAAIKGLGNIRWHWVDRHDERSHGANGEIDPTNSNWTKEAILAAQSRILRSLRLMLEDTDWSMRYAAIVALSLIGSSEAIALLELTQKQETDLAIKFRSQMALQSLLVAT